MADELVHYDAPGLTVYAKPEPLVYSPWGTDAVTLTDTNAIGRYANTGSLSSPVAAYAVFLQAGGSPASSDGPAVGTISLLERSGGLLASASADAANLLIRLTLQRAERIDTIHTTVADNNTTLGVVTGAINDVQTDVHDVQDTLEVIEGGIESGDGDIEVDHDTGGTDNLRYVDDGVGVDNATVRAYLTSDYTAGDYTVRAMTYTGSDGRWIRPMMLDAGAYTFTFQATGFQLATATATVS